MDDFLLAAITVLQNDLVPDHFVRDILDEMRKKLDLRPGNSSTLKPEGDHSFQESLLAELRRRLLLEKDLRSDITLLSEECDALRVRQLIHSTDLENYQQLECEQASQEISQAQSQDDLRPTKKLRMFPKHPDAAVTTKRNTGLTMKDPEAITARLQSEIARLSGDNILKDQALKNLEDEFSEELRKLQQHWTEKNCAFRNINAKGSMIPLLSLAEGRSASGTGLSDSESIHGANPSDPEGIRGDPYPDSESTRSGITSNSRSISGNSSPGYRNSSGGDSSLGTPEVEQLKSKAAQPTGGARRAQVAARGLPPNLSEFPNHPLFGFRRGYLEMSRFSGTLPQSTDVTILNRRFLTKHLGGNPFSLQATVPRRYVKPLAKRLGISSYMCPNLRLNPWAPSLPGQNGFVFACLTNKNISGSDIHEVFVQFAPKKMFYAGQYKVSKVDDLSPEEWKHLLKEKVKHSYCRLISGRSQEKECDADIMVAAHDEGRLRVPCAFLECVGFGWELYNSLSDVSRPADPSGGSSMTKVPGMCNLSLKRKRTIGDSDGPARGAKKP